MRITRLAALTACVLAVPAFAATVQVEVTGIVEFNQVNTGALGAVDPGDEATLTFLVDSDVFVDSASFPTRGYVIDQSSFSLVLGAVTVGLQDPFPAGMTPYFVLRNDDPAVDGFFTATSVDAPIGVPLDEPGIFEQFSNNYSVTYGGSTLSSLDILDALGSYDFTGLTVFNWTVNDGPFKPLGLIFERMRITAPAGCAADIDGSGDVNVLDLVEVILQWGCTSPPDTCSADVNGDGEVNVLDLVEVTLAWGACS